PPGSILATKQVDYFYNEHLLNTLTSGRVDIAIHHKEARRVYQESSQFFGIDPAQWKPKLDFIGLNYYRGVYVYPELPTALLAQYVGGAFTENLTGGYEPHGLLNDLGWEVYPDGLYQLLTRLHIRYRLPLLVAENGMAEATDHNRAHPISWPTWSRSSAHRPKESQCLAISIGQLLIHTNGLTTTSLRLVLVYSLLIETPVIHRGRASCDSEARKGRWLCDFWLKAAIWL
ncbi:MAG TPA: family 1 glycosylhydrolase, partial [Ktedonosporobacter sp.]|nr:family 1 glycosylhydrolase [Ktedonosporobacter sp.]